MAYPKRFAYISVLFIYDFYGEYFNTLNVIIDIIRDAEYNQNMFYLARDENAMGEIRMIYTCDKCHFIFRRAGEVDVCPDCGKVAIREANKDEEKEFRKNLNEQHDKNIKR